MAVSSDGSYIVAGSDDKNVYFFNKEGKLLWSYMVGGMGGRGVSSVDVSADGSFVAVGSSDKNLYLFNRDGQLLWSYETSNDVWSITISDDGSYIAVGTKGIGARDDEYNNAVYFFNKEGKLLWSYPIITQAISIAPSSDGSVIVAGGDSDQNVYFFNKEGKLLWNHSTRGYIRDVAISDDGSHVAVATRELFYHFDREGKLLNSYIRPTYGTVISSDGSYVAAGTEQGFILLTDRVGNSHGSYNINTNVEDIAISLSSDGSYVVAGPRSPKDNKVYFFGKTEKPISTQSPTIATPEPGISQPSTTESPPQTTSSSAQTPRPTVQPTSSPPPTTPQGAISESSGPPIFPIIFVLLVVGVLIKTFMGGKPTKPEPRPPEAKPESKPEFTETYITERKTTTTEEKKIPVFVFKHLPAACPKCASPFAGESGDVCEYCGSIIRAEEKVKGAG